MLIRTVHLIFNKSKTAFDLILSSIFLNLLALAVPLFVIQVLNRYVSYGIDETLMTLVIGVVIAILFEQAFRRIRLRLAESINQQREELVNQQSFGAILRAKFSVMMNIPASVKTEMVRGMDMVRTSSSAGNIVTLLDVPFSVLFLLVIYLVSPVLSLVALVAIAVSILISISGKDNLEEQTKALQGYSVDCNGMLVNAVDSADTLRVFNGVGQLADKWNEKQHKLQTLKDKLAFRQANIAIRLQGVTALMSVAVIAIGATQVVEGSLSVGAMIGVNDLRNLNREENLFQRKSREKYSISGRVHPITLLNRYNCLVLKLEDELTNEEILTHENNYIRPTNKKTKDGYSIQKKEKSSLHSYGEVNYGRTIFDLISGTKKSFGGKQILLSVCDGYFLKHPTKTYL